LFLTVMFEHALGWRSDFRMTTRSFWPIFEAPDA
jgi:hypothetical protein